MRKAKKSSLPAVNIVTTSAKQEFSTQVKNRINRVLNFAGLQLNTNLLERLEQQRLKHLLSKGHWSGARFQQGLCFNSEQYLDFLHTVCEPYRLDFDILPETAVKGSEEYFVRNSWFESVDAEVLYSVIRHFKPRVIVEIGSGYSSRLMRRAIDDAHLDTRLICIDPCPRVDVRSCSDEFIQKIVEDVPVADIATLLGERGLLFIDSSHVVTVGGDVPYLYLELLPSLKPGVLIHLHDIFLPFDYPKEFILDNRWAWNEQYLVHALLQGNLEYDILWPACYMWELHKQLVQQVIAKDRTFPPPSSLWLLKKP